MHELERPVICQMVYKWRIAFSFEYRWGYPWYGVHKTLDTIPKHNCRPDFLLFHSIRKMFEESLKFVSYVFWSFSVDHHWWGLSYCSVNCGITIKTKVREKRALIKRKFLLHCQANDTFEVKSSRGFVNFILMINDNIIIIINWMPFSFPARTLGPSVSNGYKTGKVTVDLMC